MLGAKFDRITKDFGQEHRSRRDALLRIARAGAVAAAVGYGENRVAVAQSHAFQACCTYINNAGVLAARTCETRNISGTAYLSDFCPDNWSAVWVEDCFDCPVYPDAECKCSPCVCGECVCPEETPST